jgi:hypothetical protein
MSQLVNSSLSIPQIAIQPSAAPIALNVLPAPGQGTWAGNRLQQVAESFSVFNEGLLRFMGGMVQRDNQNAIKAAEGVDWDAAIQRQDILNKELKQVILETGLPETANPLFVLKAETNFGDMLAQKVSNQVRVRMAELADPNLTSEQQNGLLRQMLAEETEKWGGHRLASSAYAQAAYNNRLASERGGIERALIEESLSAKESQAILDLSNSLGMYFESARIAGGPSPELENNFGTAVLGLQKFTADPRKVTAVLMDQAKTAFAASTSPEQVDRVMDSLLSLPLGTTMIAENWGLRLRLANEAESSKRNIDRLEDEAERKLSRDTAAARRLLSRDGASEEMMRRVEAGEAYTAVASSIAERYREKFSSDVFDRILPDMAAEAAGWAKHLDAAKVNRTEDINSLIARIEEGREFTERAQVIAAATALQVDAGRVLPYWERTDVASTVRAGLPQEAMGIAVRLEQSFASKGRVAPNLDELVATMIGLAEDKFKDYLHNDTPLRDGGQTYSQARAEGLDAAKAFLLTARVLALRDAEQRIETEVGARTALRDSQEAALPTGGITSLINATTVPAQREAVGQVASFVPKLYGSVGDLFEFADGTVFGDPRYVGASLSEVLTQAAEGRPFETRVVTRFRSWGQPDRAPGPRGGAGGPLITGPEQYAVVVYDGSQFVVYRRVQGRATSGLGLVAGSYFDQDPDTGSLSLSVEAYRKGARLEEIGRIPPAEMQETAIRTRIHPFGGFAMHEVLHDDIGLPGTTWSDINDQLPGGMWRQVPVFDSMSEFKSMFDSSQGPEQDAERLQFLERVLGPSPSPATVAQFRATQQTLLRRREEYRRSLRGNR